jgi:hypothetical protein
MGRTEEYVICDEMAGKEVCRYKRRTAEGRQMEAPHRRIQFDLHLEADSWDELERALDQMALDVGIGYMRSSGACGGCGSGYHWNTTEDPDMTDEIYKAKLQEYVAAIRAEREGR